MPKKSIPQKLYSSHYNLLGRCVYFLCKLDVTQLKNIVTNLDQLTKIKIQRKTKTKRRSAKQIKATKKLIAFNKRRNK